MLLPLSESARTLLDEYVRDFRPLIANAEDDGVAKDWRPSAIVHAKYAYGQWLKFLEDSEPSSLAEPPAGRFTAERRHVAITKRRDKRTVMVRADELFGLGMDLMAMAQRDGVVHDLLAYRDGLIIALLASRPLRRKNLADMRLDKHVAINGG